MHIPIWHGRTIVNESEAMPCTKALGVETRDALCTLSCLFASIWSFVGFEFAKNQLTLVITDV